MSLRPLRLLTYNPSLDAPLWTESFVNYICIYSCSTPDAWPRRVLLRRFIYAMELLKFAINRLNKSFNPMLYHAFDENTLYCAGWLEGHPRSSSRAAFVFLEGLVKYVYDRIVSYTSVSWPSP